MSKCILGTLNFDYEYVSEKFSNDKICKFLKICLENDVNDIDTAYYYNQTESLLGNTKMMSLFNVSSKANPWFQNDFTNNKLGQLSSHGITSQLNTTLKNLSIEMLDIYYMHCWDYETDILETLKTFDTFYRKEKFKRFGVSNISYKQLLNIIDICDKEQLQFPTVYQGMYNIYCRKIEEIFPVIVDYNMSFIAYNPLAGGLLTGKYANSDSNLVDNSRFNGNAIYKTIYWNNDVITYSKDLNASMSLRWLKENKFVDGIIMGASTENQLKNNINIIKYKTPLSNYEKTIIKNFYDNTHIYAPNYYY